MFDEPEDEEQQTVSNTNTKRDSAGIRARKLFHTSLLALRQHGLVGDTKRNKSKGGRHGSKGDNADADEIENEIESQSDGTPGRIITSGGRIVRLASAPLSGISESLENDATTPQIASSEASKFSNAAASSDVKTIRLN
eukprot:jgi/Hompol1/5823/HPOL_004728-RA